MKIYNSQNNPTEEYTGRRKKSTVLLTVFIIILVLICLLLRSCRARDEPAIIPPEREYETSYQELDALPEEMIPTQENQRLNLIISDSYQISDEEPCFCLRYPEENIFDVVFTIKDSAGKELYRTNYVAPGKNVAINITESIPKGEQTVDCLVSVFDHETGAPVSSCTTVALNISYQ